MRAVDFIGAKTLRRTGEALFKVLRRSFLQEKPSPHQASVILDRLRELTDVPRKSPVGIQASDVMSSNKKPDAQMG